MEKQKTDRPLTGAAISLRLLAGWEITSVVVSCLIAEWVFLSYFGKSRWLVIVPVLMAMFLIVASHRAYGETLKDIGLTRSGFGSALKGLALPTVLAVLVVALIAGVMGEQGLIVKPFRQRYLLLPVWALFQQYVLQGYINRRAQVIFGRGLKSIFLVALIFSLAHLPNPGLALLTFFGGFIWAAVYQMRPNLFALAISHTFVSISLALLNSEKLLGSFRVGFKYFG